nr:hypothetical protein [Tanacetum cinerariifolium]
MTKPTMEEYMTKTREDYGLGIARPKIDEKARPANRWLRNEPTGSIITWETLKMKFMSKYCPPTRITKRWRESITFVILFYKGLDVPTRQILDSKGVIPSMKAADAKKAIQDMADHSQKWHNRTSTRTKSTDTSDGLAAIQAQLNNLGKEIKKEKPRMRYQNEASLNVHDSTILEDSLPPKEKDLGSFTIPCLINNICFEKALADLGASVSVIPYSTFTNLGLGELAASKLIIELADRTIKRSKGIAENVLVRIDKFIFPIDFIVLDMPEDIKVPLILRRPFLSTAHAKIDVFKKKIALRVGDEKLNLKLDLEARLMGEALILNRSLDLTYGDYIELNDLNEPIDLRRNQEVDNFGLIIEVGEIINEPMVNIVKTRNDDDEIEGIDEYPSFCDFDKKIHIDCAYNLHFSCMIGNMDAYRDQDMGEVIVGESFCREIYVKARRNLTERDEEFGVVIVWNSMCVVVMLVNDVTRLQVLVDKKKVVVTEATIREALRLDDEEGVDCLPNEEIFAELARMGYEKPSIKLTFYKAFFSSQWKLVRNVDSLTKFYMYPRFLQLIIRKQVDDLSNHTTKYTSSALTQKVFANMRRVGKGFSRVETPLFEGDVSAAHGEVPTIVEEQSIPSPTPPTSPPQPPQDIPSTSQGRMIAKMDQDDAVVLEDDKEEDREVADAVKDVEEAKVDESEDETEPTEVQEVVDVVTIAKLITEVVTAASETVTAASAIITTDEAQVPTATLTAAPDKGKGILVEEPKPLKKKQQIEQDEQYSRELHAELNKDIDWDKVIDHVKIKAKEDPAVKNYQALKRKP